jgi:hypothetical protein
MSATPKNTATASDRGRPPPGKEEARHALAGAAEPDLFNNSSEAFENRNRPRKQGRASPRLLRLGRDFLAPQRGER